LLRKRKLLRRQDLPKKLPLKNTTKKNQQLRKKRIKRRNSK